MQNARHRLSSWPVTGIFICIGSKLKDFLHPNHVVIAVELAATLMEGAYLGEAQMGMEIFAVVGEGFVRRNGGADAGVEIGYTNGGKFLLQNGVKLAARAVAFFLWGKIDGEFRRMVVGFSAHESSGIGVADNFAVPYGNKIGIAGERSGNTLLEFSKGRHADFKGYGGVFYVIAVDGEDGLGIFTATGEDAPTS